MKRLRTALLHAPQRLLIGLVRAYRLLFKPWLGNACRFEPSCSAYALEALQGHGALRGAALTGWRLVRCHPWCDGGLDPVPPVFPMRSGRGAAAGLFTRLPRPLADRPPGPSSHP